MVNTHYTSYVDVINRDFFDRLEKVDYFRALSTNARHFTSPIRSQGTQDAFCLEDTDFGNHINAFILRELNEGRVIPIDGPICVEDEFSAVFVENDVNNSRTLKLTTYMNIGRNDIPYKGVFNHGSLSLVEKTVKSNLFKVSNYGGVYVLDNSIKPIEEIFLEDVANDLVNSATTIIEQLAYMDDKGLITETKRRMN